MPKEPRIIAPFAELEPIRIEDRIPTPRTADDHAWVGSGPNPDPEPVKKPGLLSKIFPKKETSQTNQPIAQYAQKLNAALQAKFPNTHVSGSSGMSTVKGMISDTIGVSHIVTIKLEQYGTMDVILHGEIRGYRTYPGVNKTTEVYNSPFLLTKTVFPDDDPAVIADWVFTETQRRVSQAERDMKARGTDKLPFPY